MPKAPLFQRDALEQWSFWRLEGRALRTTLNANREVLRQNWLFWQSCATLQEKSPKFVSQSAISAVM